MKEIDQLIEISRHYGADSRFVIAGGGNTSFKNAEKLWIKASGAPLATITEDGFAVLDRKKLSVLSTRAYSADSAEREEQVKNDLASACISQGRRPSVETSLHDALSFHYVVHLHPTLVNAVMCANEPEVHLRRLFGEKALYIPYTDPGYVLFKVVGDSIAAHRKAFGEEPAVIWLQNHGIFVGANTVGEIEQTYTAIIKTLTSAIKQPLPAETRATSSAVERTLPGLRMMLSADGLKTLKVRTNALIELFSDHVENQAKIARPFTPDAIVYCKSNAVFMNDADPESLLAHAAQEIPRFRDKHGYLPKVMVIKGIGLVAVGDNAAQCDIILDVFEDAMKVAFLADSFGGEHPMTQAQIDFIDNWEVENYRRAVAAGGARGRAENRTIIVTGAAQGFGEGVARCLVEEGANVVVADLNEVVGRETEQRLGVLAKSNRVVFVKTDVGDAASLAQMVHQTVCEFGAIDCFISNAGVLRAGGLDDMSIENFDFVTKINYSAFFYCTRAVAPVMKLQTRFAPVKYYADILQINSKSGLRGSKANFAYAGGKFGGVGLTQSFALELAPFRIKVNAICPGNYFEGPLWSDPESGLFVQYLKAGKVPGAKTVDDVKGFYLAQVPMNKGCSPADVTKGVLYLIDQCGETGQALPITGGQVMLS